MKTAGFWPQIKSKAPTKLHITRIHLFKVNYSVAYKTQVETWYTQA